MLTLLWIDPFIFTDCASMSLKILVIDDFHASAEMLSLVMEMKGYVVKTAFDGDEALATLDGFIPDVVLCDINMPKLPGYQVCMKMKADPRLSKTLFIAQTAVNTRIGIQLIEESGFDYHLVKPLDIGVLDDIIRRDKSHPV